MPGGVLTFCCTLSISYVESVRPGEVGTQKAFCRWLNNNEEVRQFCREVAVPEIRECRAGPYCLNGGSGCLDKRLVPSRITIRRGEDGDMQMLSNKKSG
jgi:hypothetical protein